MTKKLARAAKNGDLAKIKELAKQGYRDSTTWLSKTDTALIAAAAGGHTEIVRYLLDPKNGAMPASKDIRPYLNYIGSSKNTALMAAVEDDHYDVCKILLENGADINLQRADTRTALILAIENKCIEIGKMLVEAGADLKIEYKMWRSNDAPCLTTALTEAVKRAGNDQSLALQIIKTSYAAYLASSAPKTRENNPLNYREGGVGMSALLYAAKKGHTTILKELLARGVYLYEIRVRPMANASQISLWYGHLEEYKLLVEAYMKQYDEQIRKVYALAELERDIGRLMGIEGIHVQPESIQFAVNCLGEFAVGLTRNNKLPSSTLEHEEAQTTDVLRMALNYAIRQPDSADFEAIIDKQFPNYRSYRNPARDKKFARFLMQADQLRENYQNFYYIKFMHANTTNLDLFLKDQANLPLKTISAALNKVVSQPELQTRIVSFLGGPLNRQGERAAIAEATKVEARRAEAGAKTASQRPTTKP